ncbi:MAG: lysophospholipid acyltransferase family protein [Bacteroidales bacterium]|jgi:KDO2-lipid IV(A) lauroyltransferase
MIPRAIRMILWVLSWLPGFILRFIANLIHIVVFLVLQYRSEVIENNIRRSFPELSEDKRRDIASRFFQHFSELFMEMIIFLRLKPKQDSKRIRFSDPEMINRALEQKKNIIIIAGHYGNWEWNLLPMVASGYRVFAVYKPQSSDLADQLMKRIRHKPGIELVSMKDTLRVISRELKEKNSPFALLLVSDQTPARGDIRFWTPFLNQDTAFFTGGEKLAKKFGFPVFYADQIKQKFATYLVRTIQIYDGQSASGEGDITREFVKHLEESIRREPYLWLWSHRRWKYRREELPLQA